MSEYNIKVWVRLRLSSLIAAINSLRDKRNEMDDIAQHQEHAGEERLASHTRAERDHLDDASREIADEKARVMRDGGSLDAAVTKEAKGEP